MKRNRKLALVKPQIVPAVPTTRDEKLQAAIDWLGDRYVLSENFKGKQVRVGVLNEWIAARRKPQPLTVRENA